ncbi:sigma-70 family RNA polymerase sigma factor [candidate division KSB1 bacterium]|nr:sigma-70 family RNA polymerase sigma factor [candidate division KSB1 bacterium]
MSFSESELIERAVKGDRQAQAEIVYQHEKMVYNLALKLVGNPEDAENILQETFLKILESLHTFKGGSALSTWIYRIATNFALMHLRTKKRNFVSIDEYPLDEKRDFSHFFKVTDVDPLKDLLNTELKENLQAAIDSLPPKFKTVFILKDIEGLSLKEISTMLKISLPAVKSNLHRARLFLRNQLMDYFNKK